MLYGEISDTFDTPLSQTILMPQINEWGKQYMSVTSISGVSLRVTESLA